MNFLILSPCFAASILRTVHDTFVQIKNFSSRNSKEPRSVLTVIPFLVSLLWVLFSAWGPLPVSWFGYSFTVALVPVPSSIPALRHHVSSSPLAASGVLAFSPVMREVLQYGLPIWCAVPVPWCLTPGRRCASPVCRAERAGRSPDLSLLALREAGRELRGFMHSSAPPRAAALGRV